MKGRKTMSSAKLEHIGIVVKDTDEALRLISLFGIQEVQRKAATLREVTVHGKVVDNVAAPLKVHMGPIGLEIFPPHSIQREFFEKTGGGIHHFAFVVDDLDKTVDEMVADGARIISTGRVLTDKKPFAYYVESDKIPGVIIELLGNEIHPFEFKY